MRVEQAIRMLSENYQPNDEILIEWWDKKVFDQDGDNPISDDEWAVAVSMVEDWPNEFAMNLIYDQVEMAIRENGKV